MPQSSGNPPHQFKRDLPENARDQSTPYPESKATSHDTTRLAPDGNTSKRKTRKVSPCSQPAAKRTRLSDLEEGDIQYEVDGEDEEEDILGSSTPGYAIQRLQRGEAAGKRQVTNVEEPKGELRSTEQRSALLEKENMDLQGRLHATLGETADGYLDGVMTDVGAQENEMAKKDAELSLKDNKLAKKEAKLKQSRTELLGLMEQVENTFKEATERQNMLKERDAEISRLESKITKLEAEARSKQMEMDKLTRTIAEQREVLTMFHSPMAQLGPGFRMISADNRTKEAPVILPLPDQSASQQFDFGAIGDTGEGNDFTHEPSAVDFGSADVGEGAGHEQGDGRLQSIEEYAI